MVDIHMYLLFGFGIVVHLLDRSRCVVSYCQHWFAPKGGVPRLVLSQWSGRHRPGDSSRGRPTANTQPTSEVVRLLLDLVETLN